MTRYRDKLTGDVVELVWAQPRTGFCAIRYADGMERARHLDWFCARFEPVQPGRAVNRSW